ncbi:hypothetical protein [Lishizhenia sp.]|uniref:hypothetical protein n=1 Tax=Lishizhenia sp. TaxID=2497594 RepID=UPI00299ECFB5|nr:hypothetical protein [Lishizhenia sp.]MDX1444787.1 hypothetical protein [Lishizhenia sp.]
MMNKLSVLALALISVSFAFSQEDVQLTTKGQRPIEKAYRISDRPVKKDSVIPAPTIEYPLLSLKHETSFTLDQINPARVNINPKLDQLYRGYAKVGIGSDLITLGELYYNSLRSRKHVWGLEARHISSFNNMSNYAPSQYDRTKSSVFGQINEKKYSLYGEVNYNNLGLHHYGFQDKNANRDSIANRFQQIGFNALYESHKKDSAELNYVIGASYYNFFDKKHADSIAKWRARENNFTITSDWKYRLNNEVFKAAFNVKYNNYQYGEENKFIDLNSPLDTGFVSSNLIFQLKPTVTTYSKDKKLRATAGFDVTIDSHDETKAHFYPILEAKYSMLNDLFIPYAGLNGQLKQNTYSRLSNENEFLLSNIRLDNESQALNAYFGIKGTLSKRIAFNLSASFSSNRNKALFVNDTTYSAQTEFAVIYDTINITKLEASLTYQQNEKLKVDAIGRFNSYQARNNPYAWNLPQLEIILRGEYNLFDKFLLNLTVGAEAGRRALVYDATIENAELEDGIYSVALGTIVDANLGFEYRYNKRFSAYINFNNFAAQRYNRWYNYPVQGFQVLGGFTFRF